MKVPSSYHCCFNQNTFVVSFSEANQEKIVKAGGLTSLLTILRSSNDETILRVAAGAIANLAMNGELCITFQYTGSSSIHQDMTFPDLSLA